MEMWELFLKGLAKTIEEFTVKMIEKGKHEKDVAHTDHTRATYSRPSPSVTHTRPTPSATQSRTPVQAQDVEKLQESIKDVLQKHPQGITMKSIARELDVQWHFLRIPMRLLIAENAIIKQGLMYLLPVKQHASPAPDVQPEEIVSKPSIDSISHQGTLYMEDAQDSQAESKEEDEEEASSRPGAPRRRIVDASQLEEKPKVDPALSKMSVRERESLRYRIMTALRGRPEGLNLEKIVEVLGENTAVVAPILYQLQEESKVVKQQNGKFRLP